MLLRESQRLREELMRTAAKLEAFAEQLILETSRMGGIDGDGPGDSGADTGSD
jgi:hypothetical protein